MGGGQVAIRHGLRGSSWSVVSACASAADAIGAAGDLIRSGSADIVVAGGAEAAVNPLLIAGFAAVGALSRRNGEPERASRPFDIDRDGFVTGEGAGVLMLERAAHAAARVARALAELAGYGATNDARHAAQPSPGGAGAARALRLVLADAGCDPGGDIDHCSATAPRPPRTTPRRLRRSARCSAPTPTRSRSPARSPRSATCSGRPVASRRSPPSWRSSRAGPQPRPPGPGLRPRRRPRRPAHVRHRRGCLQLVRLRRPQRGARVPQGVGSGCCREELA